MSSSGDDVGASSTAGSRDLRLDIVKLLETIAIPGAESGTTTTATNLIAYFANTSKPYIAPDAALTPLKAAAMAVGDGIAGTHMRYWLGITEHMMQEVNDRFNHQADQMDQLQVVLDQANVDRDEAKKMTDTLQAAVTAMSTSGSGGGSNGGSTLPHPQPFTGSEQNSIKRTDQFLSWKSQVMARWDFLPGQFRDEYSKIIYASIVLGGPAAAGVQTSIDKIRAYPKDPSQWPWKSSQALMEHLSSKYATADRKANASIKMLGFKQKGVYSNFTDFLTEFANNADILGWDNTSRVRELRQRVSGELDDALKVQVNIPGDEDWDEWIKMTQQLAINIERQKHRNKWESNSGSAGNKAGSGADNLGGDPMDLDRVRINRISQAERERRQREGLCYKCGRAGHIASGCKAQNSNNSNRGGRGGNRCGHGGGGGSRGGYHSYQENSYNNQANVNPGFGSIGGYSYNNRGNAYPVQHTVQHSPYPAWHGGGRGDPASRHGGRASYNGYNSSPHINFIDTPQPGHVLGEVGNDSHSSSENGSYQYQYSGTDSETISSDSHQGNA